MHEKQIIKYIHTLDPKLFNLSKISDVICTKLHGGLHNVNFKVTVTDGVNQRICVLRTPDSNKDAAALASENYYVQLLQNSGTTPKILHYSQDTTLNRPIIISEFITGKHLQFDELDNYQITLLAQKLVRIHAVKNELFSIGNAKLPKTKGTLKDYAEATVREKITKRYKIYSKEVVHDAAAVNQAQAILHTLLSGATNSSWDARTFSLCHGDIGAGNIIWADTDLWFIDWDDARFGDPADDIGYIFAINHMGPDFQRTFLDAYSKESKDASIASRTDAYVLKNYLFDVVWAIGKLYQIKNESSLIEISESQYREMYEQRLSNLKTYMASLEG